MEFPQELRYKHVEAAFQRYHRVDDDELKAFRARFRHFRNIGIPDLPKVGSGTQLTYTEQRVLELFLAFELQQLGLSPLAIKSVLEVERANVLGYAAVVRKFPKKELYFGFQREFLNEEVGQGVSFESAFQPRDDFLKHFFSKKVPVTRCLIINMSRGLREVYAFLEEAMKKTV